MVQFELSEAQRYRLLLLFIRADTSKEGCLSMQVRRWTVAAPGILGLPTAYTPCQLGLTAARARVCAGVR